MSVVKRLSDWPPAAEKRAAHPIDQASGERPSAEIIILPCVRRERPEIALAEVSSHR